MNLRWWLTCIGVAACIRLAAQGTYPPAQVGHMLELRDHWTFFDKGHLTPPFLFKGISRATLGYTFAWQASVQDSIYLWLDGLGGEAEIELNGRYIGLYTPAFGTQAVALHPGWLTPEDNRLTLRLDRGKARELDPYPIPGITRPVYILSRTQRDSMMAPLVPVVYAADSVAIVAPWYRSSGYLFDAYEAARTLLPLKERGIRTVWFPFEPCRSMRAMCGSLGLRVIPSIAGVPYVAYINPYPQAIPSRRQLYWLDADGGRTTYYGTFVQGNAFPPPVTDHTSIVLLVLLVIPVIFVVRVMAPGIWTSARASLLTPKLFIDVILDSSYSNMGLMFIIVLLRVICMAVFGALLLYYINLQHQWSWLEQLGADILLMQIFRGETGPGGLFVKCMLILSSWHILKYALMTGIGSVYRVKNMLPGVVTLDVVGFFPLAFFLPAPMALVIFMDKLWGGALGVFLLLVAVVYLARRVYILYIGLERVFHFSTGVKFLYICSLNILPYAIWF
ncbi:MAG: hypothetical protein SF053_07700 [Bacteroidia bacterium]|nr:hypothetical protein [Bacteroidia bacterium]